MVENKNKELDLYEFYGEVALITTPAQTDVVIGYQSAKIVKLGISNNPNRPPFKEGEEVFFSQIKSEGVFIGDERYVLIPLHIIKFKKIKTNE